MERAPYGRQRQSEVSLRPYRGETYYDLPPLKSSHYGELIAGYLFVGGLAGASQVLATVVDFCGSPQERGLSRSGRYLALAGAVISPVLLIADLKKPARWYNMLRIFRPTSPMSIGSWVLTGFGALSSLAALSQYLADRNKADKYREAAVAAGLPAAFLGGVVSTYTGPLLAATSTPLWARSDELLPALFAASSMATACAAVSLATTGKPARSEKKLELLALATVALEGTVTLALERRLKRDRLELPLLKEQPQAPLYRYGYKGVGVIIPLVIHTVSLISRRHSKLLSVSAAVATLAGGYLLRSALVAAGNSSARRAEDYFTTSRGKDASAHRPALEHRSPKEQCRDVVARIDSAMKKHGREFIREMDEVERLVVQLRDGLIERLRRDGGQDAAMRDNLDRINSALSMIIGLEYPITGIRRATLDNLRDTLADLAQRDNLADPSPQFT